jgi:hypothetical protein
MRKIRWGNQKIMSMDKRKMGKVTGGDGCTINLGTAVET